MTSEFEAPIHTTGTGQYLPHDGHTGQSELIPPERWQRGRSCSPAPSRERMRVHPLRRVPLFCGLLCVLLFSGCGIIRDRLLGSLESRLERDGQVTLIEGDRSSTYGFSISDSTIAVAGVENTSDAWSHDDRSTTWETATIPGTDWDNFGYEKVNWTFGSDGAANVPDGGVRYRGVTGREIILLGDTGAAASVPDPDGVIDECFSRVPPRLTLLAGNSLTISTIGAGEFHGLGLEMGLLWREPIHLFDSPDSEEGNASMQWIAEYTLGHARSFRHSKGAGGERTKHANFLLGYTPAHSNIGLQVGWRIDSIHQYGGLDQTFEFNGPVVQLGWEFGPERKGEKEPEEGSIEGALGSG